MHSILSYWDVSTALVVIVYITGVAIICIGNSNNYHLFNNNPYIYYGVYSNVVSLGWAVWTSCCTGPLFGIFVYFLAHMKLMQCKAVALQIQLKRIVNSVATCQKNRQVISTRRLCRHLVKRESFNIIFCIFYLYRFLRQSI